MDNLYRRFTRWGPWVYAALLLGAANISHFAVLSNDSFPLRWQSEHLSLKNPSSLYDGFFPIGYPLLIRAAALVASPFRVLEVVQILCSVLYFRVVYRFASAHLDRSAAAMALPFLIFSPQLIRSELSAVPDFFAALAVLGAIAIWTKNGKNADSLAGLCLGVGLLFRTHVFVFAIAVSIASIVLEPNAAVRRIGRLLLGVLPFVIAQGVLQLWSGHGFFESCQAFNLWKTMHGVDWSNPPAHFNATIPEVILAEPQLFIQTYITLVVNQLFLLVPLALYLAATVLKKKSGPLMLLALTTFFYILLTVAGGSPRSVVPILPNVVVCVVALFRWVSPQERTSRHGNRMSVALVIALLLLSIVAVFSGAGRAGSRVAMYTRLQSTLGLSRPADANGVYSDDYALYFPGLREATPRRSGGWAEIGLPGYTIANPHLADSIPTVWYGVLVDNHVHWLALREPPISPRACPFAEADTIHFQRVPFDGPYSVYRVR